jgi:hypothetical protein
MNHEMQQSRYIRLENMTFAGKCRGVLLRIAHENPQSKVEIGERLAPRRILRLEPLVSRRMVVTDRGRSDKAADKKFEPTGVGPVGS